MNNLDYRRDGRPLSKFKSDMKIRTKREGILAREWAKYNKDLQLEDSGADNEGELIPDNVTGDPDFRAKLGDKGFFIDVKNSPANMATFKADNLNYFARFQEPCIWLVFLNTNMWHDEDIVPSRGTEWFIIKKPAIKLIKDVADYNPYGHPGFGGKASYRLFRNVIEQHFEIQKLYI